MTIPTEVIMRMATLGLNEAQAKAVADMLTAVETATAESANAQAEIGKEKARARWRRWKEGQGANDGKRLQTTANDSQQLVHDRVAPVSDKPITTETDSSKNTTSRDLAEFKGVLASLDAEQIGGLVKIRKAKKAPITGYAASLFLKAAATCGLSVSAAADMCIERNWLTVKPEWMPQARGSPSRQAQPKGSDFFDIEAERLSDERARNGRGNQGDWDDAAGVPLIAVDYHG